MKYCQVIPGKVNKLTPKNIKTYDTYTLVYLGTTEALSAKDEEIVEEILAVYKLPSHLTNIIVGIQLLTRAHKSLVFKGQDSKGRWQYTYGKDYVSSRTESRGDVIKHVRKVWKLLSKRVDEILQADVASKDLQLGLITYLMMRLFIRTGKHIHYKTANTKGLITLQTSDITFQDNRLILSFVGKDNVSHTFSLETEAIEKYKSQAQWAVKNSPDKFLFAYEENGVIKVVKEFVLYDFLDEFDLRPKNIRTYGANMIFITEFLKHLQPSLSQEKITKTEYKKIVSSSIDSAAAKIGHTKNVSKRSYLATQVLVIVEKLYEALYTKTSSNMALRKKLSKMITAPETFIDLEL